MSLGRPRGFNLETVLESAMCFFWRRGYEATSLQDLLSVMKLSKSSFYQIFESKKNLFQRCVNYYRDDLCNRMKTRLADSTFGRAFIEDTFYARASEAAKPGEKQGCLISNAANEFAQRDPVIANLVFEGKDKNSGIFSLRRQTRTGRRRDSSRE